MSVAPAARPGAFSIIDAYAHVGEPRFGSAARAVRFFASAAVERMALVLFPGAPDLPAIDAAHAALGERVRVFGIPYGREEREVLEIVEAQIRAGVVGFRFTPGEIAQFPNALERIGAEGRILYATNPSRHPEVCERLVAWLDDHPESVVISPHFLRADLPQAGTKERSALDSLVEHPHFAAILSRHGGAGSTLPYPHEDFLPWVGYLVDRCGWEKLLWGSEYPVLFWRNESYGECITWLERLAPDLFAGPTGDERRMAYLSGNSERLVFARALPPRERVRRPAWMEGRFDPTGSVPLFPKGLNVPMDVYAPYLDAFLERLAGEPGLRFEEFMIDVLRSARTGSSS